MGTDFSRPLPVELPDFFGPPLPPDLDFDNVKAISTVPIHMRRHAPGPPTAIEVAPTRISREIVHDLIPNVFPAQALVDLETAAEGEAPKKKPRRNAPPDAASVIAEGASENAADKAPANAADEDDSSEDDASPTVSICIEDNALNHLLLHHALLGFTVQTAPVMLRMLLESTPAALVSGDHSQHVETRMGDIKRKAALFERSVLAVNLHSLSALLCSARAWAFTLALEPSPYFGRGGLEARVYLYGPRNEHVSFHVLGVASPRTDIPRLYQVLKTICPQARLRCLGVAASLQAKEHNDCMGRIVSSVIAYMCKLSPQKPRFFTPDVAVRGKRPALMPLELAATSEDELRAVVQEYRGMLDLSWSADEINKIFVDLAGLRDELGNWMKAAGESGIGNLDGGSEAKNSLSGFNKAWEFADGRFSALHKFVAGLASAFLYTAKKRTLISMTGLDERGGCEGSNRVSADLILQEQQFEELRSLLKV